MHSRRVARYALNLAFLMTSCAEGASDVGGPHRPLGPYTGNALQLFDDAIEASAVGLHLGPGKQALGDNALRERTQVGDAVLRVRVVTITSKREDQGQSWQLGLRTLEKLAGAHPPPGDFTLQVGAYGPGAGILQAFEGRLIGVTFVAFVREFSGGESGGAQMHFHLARDDRDEVDAVRAASALGEVR